MNGLILNTLDSKEEVRQDKLESWQSLNQVAGEFVAEGWVVAYLHYKVLIGRVRQGRLEFCGGESFETKYLLQIRIFDRDKELYIRRREPNQFLFRYRTDIPGTTVSAVDACQILWGHFEPDPSLQAGWVRLTEQRGVTLTLPWEMELKPGKRIGLKTRNYIDYNDIHQAGYVDCRFVDFVAAREEGV